MGLVVSMGVDRASELESMRYASIVLVSLSLVVFLVQRFIVTLFDLAFEFCVFHLSAILSLLLYLWKRRAFKKPERCGGDPP